MAGCSLPRPGNPSSTGLKILLVGIDGASWDVIDPLLARGKLANFKRLIDAGVRAPLQSQTPMFSPCIWTTIATGRNREEHAITRFVSKQSTRESPKLVASSDREVPAIWNMLSSYERSVGVVGWWVTWPAETVNGFMISDRVAYGRWESWTDGVQSSGITYPPELATKIRPLVVDALKSPPTDEMFALADFNDAEKRTIVAADKPIPFHGPSIFKFEYCEQRTYEKIALDLFARKQPELSMVFLVCVDAVSHTFWHDYRPDNFPGVDRDEAARLGRLVPSMYEHDDAYLADLLAKVDANTVVIVVSDHGFKASGRLPGLTKTINYHSVGIDKTEDVEDPVNIGQSGIHDIDGVFIACGGPFLKGATPKTKASVLDVTPTVLALLGLPVAKNMPGRVLDELIDPKFLSAHPITFIDAYEDRCKPANAPRPTNVDDSQRTDVLKSLGYTDVGAGQDPKQPEKH